VHMTGHLLTLNAQAESYAPFFNAAAGLLAGTPLRGLRFVDCELSHTLLPQLRLLTGLTALGLHGISGVLSKDDQLNSLFKVRLWGKSGQTVNATTR